MESTRRLTDAGGLAVSRRFPAMPLDLGVAARFFFGGRLVPLGLVFLGIGCLRAPRVARERGRSTLQHQVGGLLGEVVLVARPHDDGAATRSEPTRAIVLGGDRGGTRVDLDPVDHVRTGVGIDVEVSYERNAIHEEA